MIEATTAEMAEAIGVSPRRLQQMVGEGVAVRTAAGLYDFEETARRYIAVLRQRAEKNATKRSLTEERARLAREQAISWELRNDALRRTLVRADEAEATWQDIKTRVRERLLRIPSDLEGTRPSFTPEVTAVMRREIEQVLTALDD
jgi:phage terminase Nu1 subunit (DNA packaging protein)